MRFINITLKLGNMRKEQSFTLYPLNAESKVAHIQSDQRWATIDLETGKGRINKHGRDYANSLIMSMDPLDIQLSPIQLMELQHAIGKMIGRTNSDGTFDLI